MKGWPGRVVVAVVVAIIAHVTTHGFSRAHPEANITTGLEIMAPASAFVACILYFVVRDAAKQNR